MEKRKTASRRKSVGAMKSTKIVATIGPATESPKILEALILNGMNVARLNFSHGEFAWHKRAIKRIRTVSRKLKVPIAIMADLQGPRIRIANETEVSLKSKETVWVKELVGMKYPKEPKNSPKVIYIDLDRLVSLVKPGSEILIEDGLIRMKVVAKNKTRLECEVIDGGTVKSRKGVNIPGISGKLGAITERDREVLRFSLKEGVDLVALSFVRNAQEIKQLKNLIKRRTEPGEVPAQVVAKIERREAVENIDEIIQATDAVMVARGDLGVEMPQAELPIIQKEIIAKCLKAGKPVIVATQMMDSMIRNPRPTRAEISDVSNAVIDHADAVMLSGETANGKYPVETVKIMNEIAQKTEQSPFDDLTHGFLDDKTSSLSAAVAQSAHELLKDSKAKYAIVASVSGFTARMIARHRPDQGIFAVTNSYRAYNQMALVWGVTSFILPDCDTLDDLLKLAIGAIRKNRLVKRGDKVVVVAGRPHSRKEHMSLVKVEEMK